MSQEELYLPTNDDFKSYYEVIRNQIEEDGKKHKNRNSMHAHPSTAFLIDTLFAENFDVKDHLAHIEQQMEWISQSEEDSQMMATEHTHFVLTEGLSMIVSALLKRR